MTLLWPLAAVIGGVAGGSLLVLMYMLRLRRRPVRVSTIQFWGDPPKDLEANIPLRMVRPAWTLLLQALAVALLSLALGRPAIDDVGSSAERVYLVIDRSASMGARDGAGGGTRLEEAKRRALEIVEGIGGLSGSRAMVVSLGARAEAVTPMTSDRGVLASGLDALGQTDEAGNLGAAIELVSALLMSQAGEGDTTGDARVILLSDGALSDSATRPLTGASLEFVSVGSPSGPRDNVGIAALAVEREASEPARVRVFLRMVGAGDADASLTVLLTLDGRELARRAVIVPPSTQRGPGERSISLDFVSSEGGVLQADLDRRDLLDADNRAGVVVPPVRRVSILLVAPGEPDGFLRDVLEEIAPGRVRSMTAERYESEAGDMAISTSDVVVFDRVTPSRPPDRASLSIGAGIGVPGLTSVGEQGRTGAAAWDRTHEVLRDVTLDTLVVARAVRLGEGRRRDLALGREGVLIAEARDGRWPRMVVAFALHESNWALSVGFPIFLAGAVDHLAYAGAPGRGVQFRAGEVIAAESLGLGGGASEELIVLDAQGREAARGRGSVIVPRSGVYEAREGAGRARLAVGIGDERESRLDVLDRVALVGGDVPRGAGSTGPREVWMWFVLGACATLVVEWAVYLRVART